MGGKATKRIGLTLMELLIVLMLITAVAGFLACGFYQCRKRAHQSVCLSNLRQIGKAVIIYAQDHDGFLPPYHNDNLRSCFNYPQYCNLYPFLPIVTRFYDPKGIRNGIDSYLRSDTVWFCPSDPFAGKEYCGPQPDNPNCGIGNHRYSSYFHYRDSAFLLGMAPTLDPPYLHPYYYIPPQLREMYWNPSRRYIAGDLHDNWHGFGFAAGNSVFRDGSARLEIGR